MNTLSSCVQCGKFFFLCSIVFIPTIYGYIAAVFYNVFHFSALFFLFCILVFKNYFLSLLCVDNIVNVQTNHMFCEKSWFWNFNDIVILCGNP